jgi:hypothetical protein
LAPRVRILAGQRPDEDDLKALLEHLLPKEDRYAHATVPTNCCRCSPVRR